jgi:hypothetical protein
MMAWARSKRRRRPMAALWRRARTGLCRLWAVKVAANIAVAEASKGPFATADGLEQSAILGRKGIEGTVAAALPAHGKSQSTGGLPQGKIALGAGQGLEIAVIGRPTHFGSARYIDDAPAQPLPPPHFGPARCLVVTIGTVDLEDFRLIKGGLYPQEPGMFVVSFDRIAASSVLDAHTLGSMLYIADNLILETAVDLAGGRGHSLWVTVQ